MSAAAVDNTVAAAATTAAPSLPPPLLSATPESLQRMDQEVSALGGLFQQVLQEMKVRHLKKR